ncbi:Glycoside hydrolase family 2 immunoglobulin-like beta-sandwich [Penicillium cf. griseofulvum]|uniref:Glycoside hydrolase family 2 immunoglobulin-like beta-sandwich n=1 Tax=Penicillium cf. griseofulvum TaxID=2972120 RepID=A0A9W9J3B6_9EURO|nr:Glycoside hydrolase family 2 immunoglobulin-like beta-sandwich [Penicillium cf. griseofulvum]KAJ5434747.1 Glycoside hydrolase family 2 immunoglobulin-like beta-sandwich [Penicillium cf. griseofulvum]
MFRNMSKLYIALAFSASACAAAAAADPKPLVASAGDIAAIPGWYLQSTTKVSEKMDVLSAPGKDVSSWHRVGARSTVMAGLLENGVYNETDLFYSDNMEAIADPSTFEAPWIYREEFTLNPSTGQYFTLKTHGITSKADIYLNGALIASSDQQQGSYGGHQYDLTNHVKEGANCLLIRAFPTNYLRDLAMGFVDWNPYPADNGTGVWRNVEISQTGAVSMSPFRILTDFTQPNSKPVKVTFRTDLTNYESTGQQVMIKGTVKGPNGSEAVQISETFDLKSNEKKTVSLTVSIADAEIWWPALWGQQPLYTVQADAIIQKPKQLVADSSISQQFGIRHVSSKLNKFNDTEFSVNGEPFQVIGAGYGPDIFMRFDIGRLQKIFAYMLDMGLNTVRLEGKQEHPELYDLADKMGMMVLAGWECCDKWEGWEYNDEANGEKWGKPDYPVAKASMLHEAEMMQSHASMLGFLVGSDFWPNDQATQIYLDALKVMDWANPIIASASKRGYPDALGPSGMKMDGPYDWVPPNYWYNDKEGAAFGFGSELGAGVGTPEMASMKKFMSDDDLESLWKEPDAEQYHMSRYDSQFYDRSLYNKALFARYGKPSSLEDYVIKSQMADYEATRSQFEGYATQQNATRPATGIIYWMLNSAWPNLHWQLFDYYLNPIGAYFGTKVGAREEHVAYDYQNEKIWLINHSLEKTGNRQIKVDFIDSNGKELSATTVASNTTPHSSKMVASLAGVKQLKDIGFLRLTLSNPESKAVLSRNVYWLSPTTDVLDWSKSDWFTTPVTKFAKYTKLQTLKPATLKASLQNMPMQTLELKSPTEEGLTHAEVLLENQSTGPAVFIRLNGINTLSKAEIAPVYWSDNYVTLWPKEQLRLTVAFKGDIKNTVIEVTGRNVEKVTLKVQDV